MALLRSVERIGRREIIIHELIHHHHHPTGRAQTQQFRREPGEQRSCALVLRDLTHERVTANIVVLATGQALGALDATLGDVIWNVDG